MHCLNALCFVINNSEPMSCCSWYQYWVPSIWIWLTAQKKSKQVSMQWGEGGDYTLTVQQLQQHQQDKFTMAVMDQSSDIIWPEPCSNIGWLSRVVSLDMGLMLLLAAVRKFDDANSKDTCWGSNIHYIQIAYFPRVSRNNGYQPMNSFRQAEGQCLRRTIQHWKSKITSAIYQSPATLLYSEQ